MNPLYSIQKLLFKTLQTILRFPKITVTVFLVALVFFGYALQYSKLELDIYDVYDPDFPSSVDHVEIKENYKDRSQMLVAFNFQNPPTASKLCKLIKWSSSLNRYSEIKGVTSLWSIRAPKVEGSKLWYPKLLNNPCEEKETQIFDLDDKFNGSFFRHMLSQTGSRDLVFDISFSGKDSDSSQVKHVIDFTDKYISTEFSDVSVSYLGLGGSRYYFKELMLKDSFYNLLVLLLILLILRLLYGTWRSGVFLATTLIGSNIFLYGSMALMGISIDILTNNLFLMVAVSATADFIFVTQSQFTESYESSFKNYMFPCFMTTFTTVVGFLSLNTSDLDIIKRFGTAAAVGALFEWIMMFIFLPSFLKITGLDKSWVNPAKSSKFNWFTKIENLKLPKFLLRILILLMLGASPAFFFLNTQDSPVENLPKDHVMRKSYADFKDKYGWEGQVYLYFPESPSSETLSFISNQLKNINLVTKIEDPNDLAKEWTRGLSDLKKDLIIRELSMSPLWERYYSKQGTLRVPLYLKQQDLYSLMLFRNQVNEICREQCRLAGQRVVYLEYGEKIGKTMIESFGTSVFLITVIIALLLWSKNKLKELTPIVISALIGPLVMLSLIALFQIPVTLVTSIFLAVMVGLAGDNAIQFVLAESDNLDDGIKTRSRASLVVTIIMMLGSTVFILQSLIPMKILGVLFVLGFFINFAGDIWGLKALTEKKS